jgi:hypothetical protein
LSTGLWQIKKPVIEKMKNENEAIEWWSDATLKIFFKMQSYLLLYVPACFLITKCSGKNKITIPSEL